MDPFALPEVLTRPLEDVVLAMKAMRVSNVSSFPFPTPPDAKQLNAAIRLLADLACLDKTNDVEDGSSDGEITKLGLAVSQLPLGVRYGKMVLVAAEAGVLDYAIAAVSAMAENSPFGTVVTTNDDKGSDEEEKEEDIVDNRAQKQKGFWSHRSGDVLATVLAIGAYTHAGRNAGGAAQRMACRKFCDEHGLNPVIMSRIHDMRIRLNRLLQNRLVIDKSTNNLQSLKPPNKLQERLLIQSIASGLLDNVATLAPVMTIGSTEHPLNLRSAYLGATVNAQEPLFMDRNSVLYTGNPQQLPKWVCYDTLVRKLHKKSGQTIVTMKCVTAIDPSWLGVVAKKSSLLHLGQPLASTTPLYQASSDSIVCAVKTTYGRHGWEIPSIRIPWLQAFTTPTLSTRNMSATDKYAWFARYLLEGRVVPELDAIRSMLQIDPVLLTTRGGPKAVQRWLAAIESGDLASRKALVQAWKSNGPRYLWSVLQQLVRPERKAEAERLWVGVARQYIGTLQ
jgi:ATP-dependent RNA helicase DHX37/DHR1